MTKIKILKRASILMVVFAFAMVNIIQLNIEAATAPSPMPVISRNVPTYASTHVPSSANDTDYTSTWRGTSPCWIAYDLSNVPASQRGQVLVAWYNDTYDYDPNIVNRGSYNIPKAYTIEGSSAAGGGSSAPTSGWKTLATVTDNIYHSRQHLVDLTGCNWIRMSISSVASISGDAVSINLDIHDASQGAKDSWIFYGDSITAGGMIQTSNGKGTFAQIVNATKLNYFPAAENGGIGGIFSRDGVKYIDTWLKLFPGKYVCIAYGTNDAWGNQTGAAGYYSNTETMVKAVIAAGKIPVVSKIPWSRISAVYDNVPSYNAKIDELYKAYPAVIKGPDFEAFFKANQSLISSDGVHPTTEGYNAMREQWASKMITEVYSQASVTLTPTPTQTILQGDVTGDNIVDSADYTILRRYLLQIITVFPGANGLVAADMNGDGKIDSADYTLLRKKLLKS